MLLLMSWRRWLVAWSEQWTHRPRWSGARRWCLLGLLLVWALYSTGCAQQPAQPLVTEVKTVYVLPPTVWLVDCREYITDLPPQVVVNPDLARAIAPLVRAIELCSANVHSLVRWRQQYEER